MFPLGFAGYPPDVKTCNPVQLQLGTVQPTRRSARLNSRLPDCSQWGGTGTFIVYRTPLFNMVPSANQTAVYGWALLPEASAEFMVSVGPEYRVSVRSTNIEAILPIPRASVTIWGIPAAESHDAERGAQYLCFTVWDKRTTCRRPVLLRVSRRTRGRRKSGALLGEPDQCTPGEPLVAELEGVNRGRAKRRGAGEGQDGTVHGLRRAEVRADAVRSRPKSRR